MANQYPAGTKQIFLERVKKANPFIEIVGEYINTETKVKCICSKCGFGSTVNWEVKPATLFKEKACPVCNNKQFGGRLFIGINDLETWCKQNNRLDILDEWDYEENKKDSSIPDSPNLISKSNNLRVNWKCRICGNKWKTSCNKRTSIDKKTGHSSGCPHCSKSGTSYVEQTIYYYLKQAFLDVQHRTKDIIGKELDFYIPSIKTAIEFDGGLYHRNKLESDNKKDELTKKNNIRLIRIRDKALEKTKSAEIIWCSNISNTSSLLEETIKTLFKLLKKEEYIETINVNKDNSKIIHDFKLRALNDSLKVKYPKLAEEWDIKKNNGLLPENFSPGEAFNAWWICSECGYSWQARIYSRTHGKHGCPECGAKKQGSNYSINRAKIENVKSYCEKNHLNYLLEEWDYEENKKDPNVPNTPEETPYGCNREIHWKCSKCGYKWVAKPYNRFRGISICPKCNNTKLIHGVNDFKTWAIKNKPFLLKEWSDSNIILPSEIKFNCSKKVNWVCSKCGKNWSARLNGRTMLGRGCPDCSELLRHVKAQKKVMCIETGEIYNSVKEACLKVHGKVSSTLTSHLKGRYSSAFGFHWKYLDK